MSLASVRPQILLPSALSPCCLLVVLRCAPMSSPQSSAMSHSSRPSTHPSSLGLRMRRSHLFLSFLVFPCGECAPCSRKHQRIFDDLCGLPLGLLPAHTFWRSRVVCCSSSWRCCCVAVGTASWVTRGIFLFSGSLDHREGVRWRGSRIRGQVVHCWEVSITDSGMASGIYHARVTSRVKLWGGELCWCDIVASRGCREQSVVVRLLSHLLRSSSGGETVEG